MSEPIELSHRSFVISGKESAEIIETKRPEPGKDEVRIKVAYVGICGSDLHYYFHGANGSFAIHEPLIPGHELSGTIDFDPQGFFAPGTEVTVYPAQPGQLIDGLEERPHLWHGVRYMGSAATSPHTQGGMAEYLALKREMVRPLPAGVSLKSGALAEPLAVVLHGLALAGDVRGKSILVSGSGPIGLLAIAASRTLGAKSVTATDVVEPALERARSMGADLTFNVSKESAQQDSYDVVLECSGNPSAVNSAIASVQRGGTIVQIGMLAQGKHEINIGAVVTKEIRFLGAFRFNAEMDQALELLQKNSKIEECVSHVYPLDEVVTAFEVARDAQRSGKVLVALS